MDWLKLPPLNSLRAFALVAETGSFTRAAERLNVTHAAVSQQVKALERRLEIILVARTGRGIVLTDEGLLLAQDLRLGFETIGQGVERLTQAADDRPVQITMSPAFAFEWFMPRIVEFQHENPGITLMLNPTAEVVELKPGGIDIAIRYGDRRRPRADITSVLVTDMIVVGAPDLIVGRDLSDPAFLVELPWLQELGTNEAAEWLTYHGVVLDGPLTVHHMPGNLIMEAVRRGDGVTYTARAFFQKDLESGALVELFSEPAFGTYYIETHDGPQRRTVRVFLKWLESKSETVTANSHHVQNGR
jgi:LysR family glycine cleavage system transcriptional activator